jgi:hypothetical protein
MFIPTSQLGFPAEKQTNQKQEQTAKFQLSFEMLKSKLIKK